MNAFPLLVLVGLLAQPPADERAVVEGLRAGRQPAGACAEFIAAVRRIDELRGQLEFDAAGRTVGVDLSSDRLAVGDVEVMLLPALPNLKRLRISGGGITATGIDRISTIAGLTELSMLNVQVDNRGLGRLARLGNLTILAIQRSASLNDGGLEHLKRLPKLANLGLLEINITDKGLVALVDGLPGLRLLDLRGSAQITNAGIGHLRRLKQLKVLRLGSYQINDQTLAIVKDLRGLTGLTIQESAITDPGLDQVQGLPLEEINLFRCNGITDDGLRRLAGFKRLKQVTLRDLPITGSGLVHLADKVKLAVLRLSESAVEDAGLAHLRGLKSLRRLELRQTAITDAGVASLAGLKDLEYLDLEATRVTDAGIARLAGLTKLQHLDLTLLSGVTDASVETLAGFKSLKTLNASQTGISEEGFKRLATALPGCKIMR